MADFTDCSRPLPFTWNLKWKLGFAGARYDIGLDVDEGQSRKNGLHLAPSVNFEFPKVWYLTLYPDTEIRINVGNGDKGRLFLPLDFLLL
jgi:hypothetical protein